TTKKEKGTGLGMSITYGIVKRLGGDIQVKSKLGEGTTITIMLPKKPVEG
ncbi:MAG: HAMP domain-containing histidine kinase, partial [Desulfovibrionales bacterium]|nr:HAMP domain-containing histidine kinase [Desulfovibrionales bacterium]